MARIDISSFRLANGLSIPALGIGTFPMNDGEASRAIRAARDLGCTLFGTSSAYGNERGVGKAVGGWGRSRDHES
ncbi:hypothetical protein [Collinsella ihumii]|uniref:Aldo/keto reductase n=1 Tax=Collinsella ihumii TaxID=1720204 RepID=A0AAW7JSR9_9ACTN|nr:hypothetical protein [Collinsella ihumii]MDN0069804.1 hypothetical protein [Collinsella ihumii]